MESQLEMASRLSAVTQQVGFALWQLQELESVSATYFVLLEEAEKGIGEEAGRILDEKAKKNTFGTTINRLAKADLLNGEIETRFRSLLSERNWLVHSSKGDSRNAIYHDSHMHTLISRLKAISDEALLLLKHVGQLAEAYVKKHGVTEEYINRKTKELLREWGSSDEI